MTALTCSFTFFIYNIRKIKVLTYAQTRYEDNGGMIESIYKFELVSLSDGYVMDFDTGGKFEENSNYII